MTLKKCSLAGWGELRKMLEVEKTFGIHVMRDGVG